MDVMIVLQGRPSAAPDTQTHTAWATSNTTFTDYNTDTCQTEQEKFVHMIMLQYCQLALVKLRREKKKKLCR